MPSAYLVASHFFYFCESLSFGDLVSAMIPHCHSSWVKLIAKYAKEMLSPVLKGLVLARSSAI